MITYEGQVVDILSKGGTNNADDTVHVTYHAMIIHTPPWHIVARSEAGLRTRNNVCYKAVRIAASMSTVLW